MAALVGYISRSRAPLGRLSWQPLRRHIAVTAEPTPNPDSIMFYPNDRDVLGDGTQTMRFSNKYETNDSPLAAAIFKVKGVNEVMLAAKHVTVTKAPSSDWSLMQPNLELVISQFYAAGLEASGQGGGSVVDKIRGYWRLPLTDASQQLEASERASALLPQLADAAQRGAIATSRGSSAGFEVYTGLGGIALAFYRASRHCQETPRARGAPASASVELARKALAVSGACLKAKPRSQEVSFFCGTPGFLAIACASCQALGDSTGCQGHLRNLLDWSAAALGHAEDELLFGRAGYLYALLWVRQLLGSDAADFATPLRAVAERLVETGRSRAERYDWPLMWHCFKEPYLGAAHGVVGILAMLLHCYDLLSEGSRQLVRATLQKLLSIRYTSGNVPIVLGDRRDEHVHWCHGASGLPALCLLAATVLGDADGSLRAAALQAGEVVWQRGLILKGLGLCHGIAGNAYAFLSLYRADRDSRHLARAQAFAAMMQQPEIQEAIRRQPDSQRLVRGVPDSPLSLMEGDAGLFCFLLDMAAPERSSFPGWEL
ncbi:LANCL1 [Symbiodinium natans]|uniref:LANCL1 protein n=1 Tax=Symbiodinium natans TaxID=878477 RepID=A0A812KNQ6_9DINO|nr:LANCL1 [Symbiodinium natans]